MSERPARKTVGDLIADLQAFDPALPVMVDGYEEGFDYPAAIAVRAVLADDDTSWFYGRFKIAGGGEPALIITRDRDHLIP